MNGLSEGHSCRLKDDTYDSPMRKRMRSCRSLIPLGIETLSIKRQYFRIVPYLASWRHCMTYEDCLLSVILRWREVKLQEQRMSSSLKRSMACSTTKGLDRVGSAARPQPCADVEKRTSTLLYVSPAVGCKSLVSPQHSRGGETWKSMSRKWLSR